MPSRLLLASISFISVAVTACTWSTVVPEESTDSQQEDQRQDQQDPPAKPDPSEKAPSTPDPNANVQIQGGNHPYWVAM